MAHTNSPLVLCTESWHCRVPAAHHMVPTTVRTHVWRHSCHESGHHHSLVMAATTSHHQNTGGSAPPATHCMAGMTRRATGCGRCVVWRGGVPKSCAGGAAVWSCGVMICEQQPHDPQHYTVHKCQHQCYTGHHGNIIRTVFFHL